MRGSDDSFFELEISTDFSIATEPLMIQVEKPEYQTSLAGVKIFPRSSTTMAKPLLIQVAPQHRNMAIFLCCGRTISGSVWRTWTANSTWWSEKLPRSSQNSIWTTDGSGSTSASYSTCWGGNTAISVHCGQTIDNSGGKVEQECLPERRRSRRTKQERKTDPSTIKCPDASPPPEKAKLAWMDISTAHNTKVEDEIPEKHKRGSEMIVEVDLRKEKEERNTKYATPPPAKAKLAWMESDSAKVTHMNKRENEKTKPKIKASKIEDAKTEQAEKYYFTTSKGKNEGHTGTWMQQQKGFLFIYTMAEKKVAAEKEKMKIRKEEKI